MIEEWQKKLNNIPWISKVIQDGENIIFDIYVKSNYINESFYIDYTLKLQFFNENLPIVYEFENRLDINFGHINAITRSLCLATPLSLEKRLLRFSKTEQVKGYIQIVIEWFTVYKYWEKYGIVPDGEMLHYEEGLYQDYRERFGVSTDEAVRKLMANAFEGIGSMYKRCPCGSGKFYTDCHFKQLFDIMKHRSLKIALLSDYINIMTVFIRKRYITNADFRREWIWESKSLRKDKISLTLYYCKRQLDTVLTKPKR